MKTIEEVKKIEQQARDLERMYEQKLKEMEKNTDSRIAEMKKNIEEDIQVFQREHEEQKQQQLNILKEMLQDEEKQESTKLLNGYEVKVAELVDIVIEEVKKQYGNS